MTGKSVALSALPACLFATQIQEARYYSPGVPRSLRGLALVCAGWELCRPDYELDRRAFPWLVVELVLRGAGALELDGLRSPLRAGSLFCYGPATRVRITSDPLDPFLKYFVAFTGPEAQRATSRGALRVGQARQAVYPRELQEILDRVIVEGNRKSPASSTIANDYLRIFLLKLDECSDGTVEPSRGLDAFLRARAFLEENFLRLARTDDAAHQLGMAPETLCRLFQHFSKTSPHQFVLQLRVNLAVDLLLGTNLLVKQIAEQAGFEDPYHFSRVFKKVQGISPAAFQRLMR
ncbi:MAG TPA: AraC family transcriptional regulator, partial [Anaeromyxobacter sp.]|nr:AraC family transcriptional regulator [Anaeromyxobacter sp.]